MALFDLILNIPDEYKILINKYLEILAIAIVFVIMNDVDPRASLFDKALYIMVGEALYILVVKKIIKIV